MDNPNRVLLHMAGAFGMLFSLIFVFTTHDTSTRLWAGGWILALWTCFRFTRSAGSVNLIGSTYYGGSKVSGGSITTKWIVFFTIPLLPVRSYFIPGGNEESADGGFFKTQTRLTFNAIPLKGIGIYWRQLPLIYAKALVFWAVLIGIVSLLHYFKIL